MTGEPQHNDDPVLTPWDPRQFVRKREATEVKWSRGFLRSRPERWFPGFAAQWLPLTHSLGLEAKVQEIKPGLSVPKDASMAFAGTVDDEPVGIFLDESSAAVVGEAVSPGAHGTARAIVVEYIGRRLLGSLALSWAGPQPSVVRFDTEIDPLTIREAGAIKLQLSVNGNGCAVWFALGQALVDRLDGLWRRQLHSAVKGGGVEQVSLEIAQLAVPPAMLGEYTRAGTVIDLEVPLSDTIVLRIGERPWLQARLCEVQGRLGIESLPGPAPMQTVPEGSTRLAVSFGSVTFDPHLMAELGQSGAMYATALPMGAEVNLVVRGEEVARGTLCVYEGRFAVSVS